MKKILLGLLSVILLACTIFGVQASTTPTPLPKHSDASAGGSEQTLTPLPEMSPSAGDNSSLFLPLTTQTWPPEDGALILPADFTYVGAFRLPGEGDTPPQTFAYGGNAMTFKPDGDPGNTDGFPGSLFITGHDRVAYGAVSDGSQFAEVTIPVPVNSRDIADLPYASSIQGFHNVILYRVSDLEKVANGTLQSWQPQPYAVIDIDPFLYLDPPAWDAFELGWGDQRRNRIGAVAFDRKNGFLYILELSGDGARPVIHVWKVS